MDDHEMQNPEQGRDQEAGRSSPIQIHGQQPNRQLHDDVLLHQNPTARRGNYFRLWMPEIDDTATDEEGSDQEPEPPTTGSSQPAAASQLDTGSSSSNPIPPQQFPLPSAIPDNPAALGNFHHRMRGRHGFNPMGDEIQNPSDQEMANPFQFHHDNFLSDLNPATAPGYNRHQGMLPAEVTIPSGDAIRTGSISQLFGQAAHDMGQPSRASRQTVDVSYPAPDPRPNIIPVTTGMLPGFSGLQGMPPQQPSGDVIRTGSLSQLFGQAAHDMGQPSRAEAGQLETAGSSGLKPIPIQGNLHHLGISLPGLSGLQDPSGYHHHQGTPPEVTTLPPRPSAPALAPAERIERYICDVCKREVDIQTDNMGTTAVLSCGHAFHAD